MVWVELIDSVDVVLDHFAAIENIFDKGSMFHDCVQVHHLKGFYSALGSCETSILW